MPKTFRTIFAGQTLELRADRSLWWADQAILFIADLHAGKTEHFQKYGQAIPNGSLPSDLERLSQAILELRPKRVIVLGDLFHSDINTAWQVVVDWIAQQPCTVELVRGNHDRFISNETFVAGGLIVHDEGLQIGPFTLRHHPLANAQTPVICGHLHPVHTFGSGLDALRLACFVIGAQQIILPAYGSFTGGMHMVAQPDMLIGTSPNFDTVIVKPGL